MSNKDKVVLPEPDAVISEVMGLVDEWGMESHLRGEAELDAHHSEATQEEIDCAKDRASKERAAWKAIESKLRALLAGVSAPAAQAVPDGWREKFAADVYADLAAADNQDVSLEEYPARILKVLDSIVGPRHPVVIKWRNDAIRNCIAIAYKYCRDPESHKYLKQDLEAMLTTEPAPQAQAVERGEVLVTVSGFTGSGKSAIAGEIEIMCRALGLQVEWPDSDSEKHMTHADWIAALEQYKPHVRIVECNVPHSVV